MSSQKLRDIYDALDHGNYKNAVKLCTAFLSKQPGHPLCRALHAVALERLGRADEATQLCDDIRAAAGCADDVLGTLQVVYRRCREFARCTEMYDAAWAKEADCEEYAFANFVAATRQGDAAKGQQVAMKMYRKFNKPKYLHWVVVSILLQARLEGSSKALDLASMWLQKAPIDMELLKAGKAVPFDRAQHNLVLLHLSTLRQQRKYDEALKLLETCRGFIHLPADYVALRLSLLEESGQILEAAREARAEVIRRSDCWGAAQDYIRLAFLCPTPDIGELPTLECQPPGSDAKKIPDHGARLRQEGSLPDDTSLEDVERNASKDEVRTASNIFTLLLRRANATDGDKSIKSSRGNLERTARSAQLELLRSAFAANEAAALPAAQSGAESPKPAGSRWHQFVSKEDLDTYKGLIVEYLCRFSYRSSTYFELAPFLCSLDDQRVEEILLAARKEDIVSSHAASREVTFARIKNSCTRERSTTALEEETKKAIAYLQSWEQNRNSDSVETSDKPADSACTEDNILLALVTMFDALSSLEGPLSSSALDERPLLLCAIAWSKLAADSYPQYFHFRVILVLLYSLTGCPGAALQVYNTLEVKNIQHESLSYLMMDTFRSLGCGSQFREFCRTITQFHEDSDKDHMEAINMALQSGLYHRVAEYVEAAEQICRSASWGRAVIEEIMVDVSQVGTWEALAECVAKRLRMVSSIATRPVDYWTLRTQDRRILSGVHVFPLRSPLTLEASSDPQARLPGAAIVPAALGRAKRQRPGISAAMAWNEEDARQDGGSSSSACPKFANVGALEIALRRGLEQAPGQLKLSASMLSVLGALIQKDGPNAEKLAEFVDSAGKGLAAAGLDPNSGSEQFNNASLSVRSRFIAFRACEGTVKLLRCSAAADGWESMEKDFSNIADLISTIASQTLESPKGTSGGTLRVGSRGTQELWALLASFAVVVPVVVWYTTAIPKTSGKKVKESEKPLHAARVALRSLLASLSGALTDALTHIEAATSNCGLVVETLTAKYGDGPLAALPAKLREETVEKLLESHRAHLDALRDSVTCRLAFLKAKGAFKP
eukprot:TRINITY_DN13902_c0_g2_i1.p1 TRINITY_DN13902_c0_g2~~TRINITY_DN13902_c0_g2_i1.p1  ORF type:complete len:1068 (-),score=177.91 TRINITY_DN13902_c0_g2_i1:98-3301(-)